ncbi:MAG: hypothetical protein R6V67_09635 [Spirochaetia bacterium]
MAEHMWKNILEKEEVDELRLEVLEKVFRPRTRRQVEAGVEFTKYIKRDGVNSDNYPILLELLRNGNHAIVEAMVGETDPNLLFLGVETNPYIIRTFFEIMYRHAPGQLHPLVFEIALGVLLETYSQPKEGLRKYRLSKEELNAIAKNLDEEKGQEERPNRQILDFLGDIADMVLEGLEEKEEYKDLVDHAIDVRNAFLDPGESMSEKIPELLIRREEVSDNGLEPRGTRTPEGGESE